MIILGRNFTNFVNGDYLTRHEYRKLKAGALRAEDVDARVQLKAKADIAAQLRLAGENEIRHIEIDGGIPNPFLDFRPERMAAIRKLACRLGITLSFHIPYTFVAGAIASLQESDRRLAVSLVRRYIVFAGRLGCVSVNLHPGSVPRFHTGGAYRAWANASVVASLVEIASCAEKHGLLVHLENNVVFEKMGCEIDECLSLVSAVNKRGHAVKFCFDIGHWLSRYGTGCPLPCRPENAVDLIPRAFISGAEVHLSDYVPERNAFHYPLHYQKGLLKRGTLCRLFRKFKEKQVGVVVVETALREAGELLDARAILKKEQDYLAAILKQVETER